MVILSFFSFGKELDVWIKDNEELCPERAAKQTLISSYWINRLLENRSVIYFA